MAGSPGSGASARSTPRHEGAGGAWRWAIPWLLAASASLTFAAVAWLAQATTVIPGFLANELSRQRETNGVFLYDGGYVDDADYVLLGQLQSDDYSRGGVYFIGDSELNVAIRAWELPPAERELIHNYSIGALRHSDVRSFVRMLVEDFGLLRAGGERTTIFLGLSYYLARPPIQGVTLSYYVERHGLYRYDAEGMRPAPMSWAERELRLQRESASRFMQVALRLRRSRVTGADAHNRTPQSRRLEGDWRASMRREVGELERLIDYLQARGVHVVAIFPPSGSWDDATPYQPAYQAMVRPLLQRRHVPLIDDSGLLGDEDFADGNHPNFESQIRLSAWNRRAALAALDAMGVYPTQTR